jgi:hypothetical protein
MTTPVDRSGSGAGALETGDLETGGLEGKAGPGPGAGPAVESLAYRQAFARINGLVVVGEGLADRHFRLLARAIPDDAPQLRRLAAKEGRHAREFVGCSAQLGIRPAFAFAQRQSLPCTHSSRPVGSGATWRAVSPSSA